MDLLKNLDLTPSASRKVRESELFASTRDARAIQSDLPHAATNSILTLRPSDLAARFKVASVTEVFSGSSSR